MPIIERNAHVVLLDTHRHALPALHHVLDASAEWKAGREGVDHYETVRDAVFGGTVAATTARAGALEM